jgi:hypothetical protein
MLERVLRDLEKELGGIGPERPHRDRIVEAILEYRRSSELKPFSRARLVCFGICEPVSDPPKVLIDDETLFVKTLKLVEPYAERPQLFRRCYLGLLSNYLKYDPESDEATSAGQSNWSRLRSFLSSGMQHLLRPDEERHWVSVLREHKNLLSEDPVRRYGQEMLRGVSRELEQVRAALDIGDKTWVVERLVTAAINAAVAEPDEGFKGYLRSAINLIAEKPLYKEEGLSLLVNRYAEMQETPVRRDLRDAAIEAFGNPWMVSRDAAWGRVTNAGRTMVRQWLNLELMTQFFEVLSDDPNTDRRRLDFWHKYHKQVDAIHIFLGRNAAESRRADMQQLRKLLQGSPLNLLGDPANNAFVMKIGTTYILEFGKTGNACFILREGRLPFRFSEAVRMDKSLLKERSDLRLLHVNAAAGSWEDQFADALRTLGITRDQSRQASAANDRARTAGGAFTTEASSYSRSALEAFAARHGLVIRDWTSQGGRLWVSGASKNGSYAAQLSEWGFKWADKRTEWYR